MGGYDLYGNYYPREIDAINAEMAQCSDIDRRNNAPRQQELENRVAQLEIGIGKILTWLQSLENRSVKND